MIIGINDYRIVASEVENYYWIAEDESGDEQNGHLYIVSKNDDEPFAIEGPKSLLEKMDQQMLEYFKHRSN